MTPVDPHAQRRESAVAVERQLAAEHVVPRLVIGEERFGARRCPLDGASEPSRGDQE